MYPVLASNEPQAAPVTEAGAQPIDLARLASQTAGNAALEREVLTLFADRAPLDMAQLKAASGEGRRLVAHRLVGSALAIGAGEVASLAGGVEKGAGDIAALEAAVEEAREFIALHLARGETHRS